MNMYEIKNDSKFQNNIFCYKLMFICSITVQCTVAGKQFNFHAF